mmetsp:Transcript_771/g.2782  ORF Transcript_771/g.2782 Transcript_771/m.2782 type:complete len:377 (-) Transcript_771:430-1560(-)
MAEARPPAACGARAAQAGPARRRAVGALRRRPAAVRPAARRRRAGPRRAAQPALLAGPRARAAGPRRPRRRRSARPGGGGGRTARAVVPLAVGQPRRVRPPRAAGGTQRRARALGVRADRGVRQRKAAPQEHAQVEGVLAAARAQLAHPLRLSRQGRACRRHARDRAHAGRPPQAHEHPQLHHPGRLRLHRQARLHQHLREGQARPLRPLPLAACRRPLDRGAPQVHADHGGGEDEPGDVRRACGGLDGPGCDRGREQGSAAAVGLRGAGGGGRERAEADARGRGQIPQQLPLGLPQVPRPAPDRQEARRADPPQGRQRAALHHPAGRVLRGKAAPLRGHLQLRRRNGPAGARPPPLQRRGHAGDVGRRQRRHELV